MELKDQVQGVVIGLFGAYAGGYFADLTSQAETGNPVALVEGLVNLQTPLLGVNLSDDAAWVDTILGHLGVSSTSAAYTAAAAWANGELDAGASRAEVVLAAVTYLLGDSVEAQYASVATAFKADVAAGVVYSEGEGAEVLAIGDLREAAGNPATGTSFTLTTNAAGDTFFGTANNDTITGAAGTLNNNDIIIDTTTTDNDVMNLTVQAAQLGGGAATATVRGIENINVNIDAITGNAVSYNAVNTQGATITLSSARLGFNGVAGVSNAGANDVTAGTNVTNLTVTGLTTGMVNTGAATTAAVTTAAATDEANVTVNGNVALTVNTATDVAITGTAAAVVTLAGNALTDVAVSGPVTLSVAEALADELNVTGAALVRVTGDGTADVDLSGIAAPIAIVDVQGGDNDNDNDVFTVASGASVALLAANTGSVTFNSATANGTVNVSTAVDQTELVAGNNVTTFNLSVTDEVEITTLDTDAAALNIETAADLTITDLTSTGDVVITGSGNVVITNATDANSIDVSGLAGTLTVVTGTQEVTIIGGDQLADVELGTVDNTAVVIAGSGGSRVNASALNNGETLVFQGGTGTDTLVVEHTADLSAATLTLSSVEVIELAGTANVTDTIGVTFAAAQLSGQAFTVTAEARDTTTVSVDAVAATTTINLGGLTLTNIDEFEIDASAATAAVSITGTSTVDTITASNNGDTINAGAGNDVITGGNGRDTINAGAGDDTVNASQGADTITLGAGNDVVVYDNADQSLTAVDTVANLRASLDVITDWAAGGTNRIDLSDVGADTFTAAQTVGGSATIQSIVDGLAAGATLRDAFVAVDAAIGLNEVTTFQFGGNTYVFANLAYDGNGDAELNADDLAIELTGLQSLIAANFVLAL